MFGLLDKIDRLNPSKVFWRSLFGLCLCLAAHGAITFFNRDIRELYLHPLWSMTLLLMLAGLAYLSLVRLVLRYDFSRRALKLAILTGLALRLLLFFSEPVMENDHFRFRWDGAVLANGYNPYEFAPREVKEGKNPDIPARLVKLASESPDLMERINYPYLRTIYPPLTQVAFALAHALGGYSLFAWKGLLLVVDLISLWLLFMWLKGLPGGPERLLVYWLNPILLHEIYITCHMEVLLFPFLLGALLLCGRGLYFASCAALGLGVGVKMWPALLTPLVLRPLLKKPLQLALGAGLLLLIAGLTMLPFFLSGMGGDSGLVTYSRMWEMNDAAYLLLLEAGGLISSLVDLGTGGQQLVARTLCGAMVVFWVLWLSRRPRQGDELAGVFLGAAAALYLLSPTQFPWYYLWLLPFLSIRPNWALLLMSFTLPLYYLRPWFVKHNATIWFDWGVVWLEFGPVWLLLIHQGIQSVKDRLSHAQGD
jgi:alpha-1,6-mannosyltransferase